MESVRTHSDWGRLPNPFYRGRPYYREFEAILLDKQRITSVENNLTAFLLV
jgi:hypothetical protein